MNLVMYILVNKDLKGKMTSQKLAGQVGHAAGTWMFNHSRDTRTNLYMMNNQTKIILECPEKKLLEYEQKPGYIAIRDAGHTELEPDTLTCVCVGIFDKDREEIPKEIKKMQLLHWETILNYQKYYTGKEILELISKDRIPENHLITAYYLDKKEAGISFYRHDDNYVDYYEREGGQPSLNLILTKDILYKIDEMGMLI